METGPSLHTYVTRLREARGWTMSELSRYAGVPQATISRLEGGQTGIPSLPTVRKLAVALGIPEHDLLAHAGHVAAPGPPAPATLAVLADIRTLLLQGVAAGEWDAPFAEALYALLLAHVESLARDRRGEALAGAPM